MSAEDMTRWEPAVLSAAAAAAHNQNNGREVKERQIIRIPVHINKKKR
jgi:hypothetical protein